MTIRLPLRAVALVIGTAAAVLGLALPAAAAPSAPFSCSTGLGGGPPTSPGYFTRTAEAAGFGGPVGHAWTFNGVAAGAGQRYLGGNCVNGAYEHVTVTVTDALGESATGSAFFQCHNGPSGG